MRLVSALAAVMVFVFVAAMASGRSTSNHREYCMPRILYRLWWLLLLFLWLLQLWHITWSNSECWMLRLSLEFNKSNIWELQYPPLVVAEAVVAAVLVVGVVAGTGVDFAVAEPNSVSTSFAQILLAVDRYHSDDTCPPRMLSTV